MATAATRVESRCADVLSSGRSAALRLDADARPGEFVAARAACGSSVRLAIESGAADAGATVLAVGTTSRTRTGLLIEKARVRQLNGPGVLARWRAAIGRLESELHPVASALETCKLSYRHHGDRLIGRLVDNVEREIG